MTTKEFKRSQAKLKKEMDKNLKGMKLWAREVNKLITKLSSDYER